MSAIEISSRPMRWPYDAPGVHRLVSEAWRHRRGRASLHPGDLYWRAARRAVGDLHVWEDTSGRIVGFVEQDPPDSSCDVAVHPEHRDLEQALFLWAEAQARQHGVTGSFTVGCFADDRVRHDLLASLGYEKSDHYYPHYLREVGVSAPADPPAGYSIRPLGAGDEIAARVALGAAAFGRTTLTIPRYEALRAGPGHDRELDLVAVHGTGALVAFCHAWYDPLTATGELEPLGCHPDHRRRGVTSALVEEAVRRLGQRGARQVVVYTGCRNVAARALYESLGFRVIGEDFDYVKRIGAG